MTDMIRVADGYRLAIDLLARDGWETALRVHRQDTRNCVSCGQSWPCTVAGLAFAAARKVAAREARRKRADAAVNAMLDRREDVA